MKTAFEGREFSFHSLVDVITNSSSTSYIIPHANSLRRIVDLFNTIITTVDPTKKFDDYFKIEFEVSENCYWEIFSEIVKWDRDSVQALNKRVRGILRPFDKEDGNAMIAAFEKYFEKKSPQQILDFLVSDDLGLTAYALEDVRINVVAKDRSNSMEMCKLIQSLLDYVTIQG